MSFARMITSTGPKTSSCAIRMSGVTWSMIVGPMKYPLSLPFTTARRPSTSTFAPAASASAMYFSIRSFAAAEMTGPMSRPGMMFFACSTIRSMMSSVFETATITDAAMQR